MNKLIFTFALLIATAATANAISITVNGSVVECIDDSGVEIKPFLYKSEFDPPAEEGSASLFDTTWTELDEGEPFGATVEYVGNGLISVLQLFIKDGNGACLFNIDWDGTSDLVISGWPGTEGRQGGAISHITLYGQQVGVPDSGATFAFLGLGLAGLIGFRRFRR